MLHYLRMQRVGPASKLEAEFAPRLNFITGDNGLGKTFLLDIAWWALTRTWARMPAVPQKVLRIRLAKGITTKPRHALGPRRVIAPSITYRFGTATGTPHEVESKYDRSRQIWPGKPGRPPIPGMVIYAQVDGGFSVWDPARNYWRRQDPDEPERPAAFIFQPDEVWNGLPLGEPKKLCNGLIQDWASWQREDGEAFDQLCRVLKNLAPSEDEPILPGRLKRVYLDDVRDQPTLKMPYQEDVPLIHASAGMRRIVALAYLLVWTWREHQRACEILETNPAREIIFLIDEIEAHLHPQWQRRIVPALLDVMEALTGASDVPVQILAATHSPMILASLEPLFDEDEDCLLHLGYSDKEVVLEDVPWSKQGDATSWLVSEVFGLKQARSRDAERAIGAAQAYMRNDTDALPTGLESSEEIQKELERVLPGHDPFWPRWVVHVESESEGD